MSRKKPRRSAVVVVDEGPPPVPVPLAELLAKIPPVVTAGRYDDLLAEADRAGEWLAWDDAMTLVEGLAAALRESEERADRLTAAIADIRDYCMARAEVDGAYVGLRLQAALAAGRPTEGNE